MSKLGSGSEIGQKPGGVFLGARQTSVYNRIAAKSIDFIIASAVFALGQALFSPLGILCAAAYAAFADAMGEGQSIGKRIFGLRVTENATGTPCTFQEALMRNLPFSLMFLLSIIPLFWGALVLVAIAILIFEVYLLFNLDTGMRLGDVLANTQVTEAMEDIPRMDDPGM